MEIDQALLDSLPLPQRLKLCKQLRHEQVRRYNERQKEEAQRGGGVQRKRKENKKGTQVNFHGSARLWDATARFDDREVMELLRDGFPPNSTNAKGGTLLHQCAQDDNVSVAEVLIARGASVNARDVDLWTPLHIAAACDNPDMVQLLLQNGADAAVLDIDGNFPSDHAPEGSEAALMLARHLDRLGIDSNKLKEIRLQAPRRMASDVKELLAQGQGQVGLASNDGVTLLHIASANGYREVVKLLLDSTVEVNAQDSDGWTALHVAAKYCQIKIIGMLLKKKANPHLVNNDNQKPSDIGGTEKIVDMLKRAEQDSGSKMEVEIQNGGEDADSEITFLRVNSRTMTPRHVPLSKQEELQEGQRRVAKSPAPGQDEDEDEEEDVYENLNLARIQEELIDEKVRLPPVSSTDDLASLPEVTERSILTHLQDRYRGNQIYTYVGDILIALNPFKELPYFTRWVSKQYHNGSNQTPLSPHVFAVADRAYKALLRENTSQCCIISGESGAGKTETCKFLIQHLLNVAESDERDLNYKIQQVNPLLESFGNAQTVMNDNSSRFGKFLELKFSYDGIVQGAKITEYLLEKSRVVSQGVKERNFHIFYLMFAGLSPDEYRKYGLESPHRHRYLRGVDTDLDRCISQETAERFAQLRECFKYIGFTKADVDHLFFTLSAVLHLGDIQFEPVGNNEAAKISNPDTLRKVAALLQVPAGDLSSALVSEITITRGEQIKRERNLTQAGDCRDALAKALYGRLFSWIVNGVNQLIQPPEEVGFSPVQIGILDIFGFENFPRNSFEQICINLANEQLHQYFNEYIFEREQQDCAAEGIAMTDIAFISNKPTVDLFLAKPQGIFSILDEESHFPKATDLTLARKLHQGPGKTSPGIYLPPRDGGPTFAVMHYAGKVQYDVCGILDKNRDSLPTSILFTMKTSDSLQIKEMFQGKVTRTGSLAPSTRQQKSRKISGTKSAFEFFQKRKSRKESKFGKARNKRERPVMGTERKGALTVAYHFKNSLADLMAKMNSASPHFIRCIKPNMDKTALVCVPEYVLAQLRYSGVMETVKLRQRGYAMRISCEDFLTRYDVLSLCCVPVETGHMTPLQKCKQALQNVKLQDYQVGHTKLFFRYWHVEQLDKVTETLQRKVLLAQKVVRGWLERRKYSRKLEVKRQQDRYVYQFLQGVYETCVAVFSQLDSHRVQDIQRQEEEVEAENRRKTLEEIKRKEENRRSIEALDSILDQYDDEKTPDNVYYQPMDGLFDVAMETSTEQTHYMPMAGSDDEVFGSDHHVYGNIKRDGISQVSIRERVPPPSSEEAAYAISHLFPGEDRKMSFEHLPPAPPIPIGLTREEYLHFVQEAKTDPQGIKQPPPAVPVRSPDTRLSTGNMSESQSDTDRKILGDYDLPADYDIACPVIQPPETEDQGDSCDLDPYSLPPPPLAWLNSIRRKGEKPILEVPPPDGSAGALPVDLEDYDQVEQVVAAYRKSQMPTGGVGAHQQRAAQQMSGSQQELPSRSTEQRWPPQEMNFPKGRKVAPPAVLPKPKKSSSSTPTTPSAPLNLGSPTPSQTDSTQSKIPMKPPVKNSENTQQVPRNKPVSDMRPVAPSADMRRASKPVQPGPPATYIAPPPPSFVPPPPPSVNQAQQRPPRPSGPSPGNVSQGQSGAVAAKVPKSPVKQSAASPGPQTEVGQRSNLHPGDLSPLTTSGARSSSGGVQDGPPSFVPPPPPGAPGGKRSSQGPPPSLAPQPKQTSGTGGPPSFTPPPPSPKHAVQGGQSRQPPGHHGPPPRPPSTASQPPPSPRHSSSPNRPKVSPPRPPSQNVSGQPGPTALGQPSLPHSKETVTQRGNGNGGQNNQKRMSGASSAMAKPPPSPPALQNITPAKVLKPKSPHTPMGAPPPPPPPPVSPATGKPAPTPSSAPPPPPPPPPGPPSNIPPPPPGPPSNVPSPPPPPPGPSCNIPPSSNVPPPNLPSAPPPPPPPPPPPSTSSAPPGGLLAGIANAKLKKVETGPGKDEERPMKSSKQTSAQSALIAQIQGGIKLKRSPGPKIKEIHRNDSVKVKNGPDSTGTGQSSIDPPGSTAKQEGPLSPVEGTEQINNTQQGASDFPRSPSGPNVTVVPVGNRPVSPKTLKNNAQTTVSSAIVTTDMPGPAGPATQKEKMNRLPLAGEAPVEGTPAWKRQLDEKKRREKEEEDRIEEERRRQEEIKWAGVPEWKKAIILKKENEKKAVEEQALAEERRKREEEAEYRRKYPWKFPNKDNSVSNGN